MEFVGAFLTTTLEEMVDVENVQKKSITQIANNL
jgi:hypothetical protein